MTPKREGLASVATDPGPEDKTQGSAKRNCTADANQPERKWRRVLRALLDGRTLNRFEAARELKDWCLNTTISQLEARGVTILRRDESVPGAFGPVHCCRYTLAPESAERARQLIEQRGPS